MAADQGTTFGKFKPVDFWAGSRGARPALEDGDDRPSFGGPHDDKEKEEDDNDGD
jgi:hypothetical protein